MKVEDAIQAIVDAIRSGTTRQYGYDIYIPNVIAQYLRIGSWSEKRNQVRELSPDFYAAAWELCRRGIIRPGVQKMDEQSTPDGNAGNGYSITPFGRQWIDDAAQDMFVPTEPGRFAEMLKPFRERFGPGFYERSQEAVRCYGAHAYLACCAMCGAASESILLATAIAKNGDEEKVLRAYSTSQGRSRVENMVVGQAKSYLKRDLDGLTSLLKYWRDEAAHGKASTISDNEAYTSLALLLRCAMTINNHWDELTHSST